eukprot:UN27675
MICYSEFIEFINDSLVKNKQTRTSVESSTKPVLSIVFTETLRNNKNEDEDESGDNLFLNESLNEIDTTTSFASFRDQSYRKMCEFFGRQDDVVHENKMKQYENYTTVFDKRNLGLDLVSVIDPETGYKKLRFVI